MSPDNAIALLYCLIGWRRRESNSGLRTVRTTVYMLSFVNLTSTVRGFGHVLAPLFLSIFTPGGAV